MACYSPITAWRSLEINASGKRSLVFKVSQAVDDETLSIPCGQCIGCRLERSRQWAIRCVHEAALYNHNCFITLTYDNANLPGNLSLNKKHFQDFMKRFRKRFRGFDPVEKADGSCHFPIRYFYCGEYGEPTIDNNWIGRPHYHACIFNFDFPDRELWKTKNGVNYYISDSLSELWPYGWSTVGDVTFESAAYVARYIMKKVTGDRAEDHYIQFSRTTGEIYSDEILPEYTDMSRRPGIAKGWFEQYHSDVYPKDFVVLRGQKMRPPKYYDRQYEIIEPFLMDEIKDERSLNAVQFLDNNTPDRLLVREKVQNARLSKLVRHDKGDKL